MLTESMFHFGVESTFERIVIIGAGAVGLYYGGRLAQSGREVHFLARSDYEALQNDGLRVQSIHGDFHLPHPMIARDSREIGPVDLVILAWKSTANGYLSEVLAPLMHESTQVLTLQNGLGNCEAIAAITGAQSVLAGQCFVCLNRIAPACVSHLAGGKITLGEWQGHSPDRVKKIVEMLQQAGVSASRAEDLERAQWEKLVWNIPFNGLSVADGGVTTDVLLSSPETEAEIRALMEETVAAARAMGHQIDPSWIDFNIERTRLMGAYRTSSMIDFLAGRELEIDAIWREPLRRGIAAGIAMPRLEKLLARIETRADFPNPISSSLYKR